MDACCNGIYKSNLGTLPSITTGPVAQWISASDFGESIRNRCNLKALGSIPSGIAFLESGDCVLLREMLWGLHVAAWGALGMAFCALGIAFCLLCNNNNKNNNNNLQAFQLIVLARYLLGVPKP